MPECTGCKEVVPLSGGVWLKRPVKGADGRVVKIGGRVAKERAFFCRPDSIRELTPDMEKGDQRIITLVNTWGSLTDLSDLVVYDPVKDERDGRLLIAWFVHGRGDVTRALSMLGQIEAEVKYRASTAMFQILFGAFGAKEGLYAGATRVRQMSVIHQIEALVEQFGKASEALAEIEAAREAQVEMPTGPGFEFRQAAREIYKLLRRVLDEIGNAYLGRMKSSLDPRARRVLFNIKGRAFTVEGEVLEEPAKEPEEAEEAEVEVVVGEEEEETAETTTPLPNLSGFFTEAGQEQVRNFLEALSKLSGVPPRTVKAKAPRKRAKSKTKATSVAEEPTRRTRKKEGGRKVSKARAGGKPRRRNGRGGAAARARQEAEAADNVDGGGELDPRLESQLRRGQGAGGPRVRRRGEKEESKA